MTSRDSWTKEQTELLEKMLCVHSSIPEIAKAVGKGTTAVRDKLDRMGRPKRQYPTQGRTHAPVSAVIIPDKAPEGFKTLLEAGPRDCRWPSKGSHHIVCGCETNGSQYCSRHMKIAYQPTKRYSLGGTASLDRNIVRN